MLARAALAWAAELGWNWGCWNRVCVLTIHPPTPPPRRVPPWYWRALQNPKYFAWAVGSVSFPADLPMETRRCHLKVLKIKPKPTTNHPFLAAQDLGVDLGGGVGWVAEPQLPQPPTAPESWLLS